MPNAETGATPREATTIEEAAQYLLDRFGPHVAALMAYGSRVFGQARAGSAYDFWLIYRDPVAFHHANEEFYRTHLNVPSTPAQQIALNRDGPLYYSLHERGIAMKIAVLDEENFAALCRSDWWTVKGRMQKPMRVIRTSPIVEAAILSARREGIACALNLVPREFTLEQALRELISLSYRAEVRPESKHAKVQSILQSGRAALEEVYRPLLAELPYVEARGEDRFVDRRGDEERARAAKATLLALHRSKFSKRSVKFIWRNFCSHGAPLRYLFMKIAGEIQKAYRRRFGRKRRTD